MIKKKKKALQAVKQGFKHSKSIESTLTRMSGQICPLWVFKVVIQMRDLLLVRVYLDI